MHSIYDYKDFNKDGFCCVERICRTSDLDLLLANLNVRLDSVLINVTSDLTLLRLPFPEKLEELERLDKEKFFQFCSFSLTTNFGFSFVFASNMLDELQRIEGDSATQFFVGQPVLFFNGINAKRLNTWWHSESNYQKDCRDAWHFWMPLDRDLTSDDGPLLVKEGSSADLTVHYEKIPNGIAQYHYLASDLEDRKSIECDLKRGDAVMFSHTAIHKTAPLLSDRPRVALVFRFFKQYADDRFSPVLAYHKRV